MSLLETDAPLYAAMAGVCAAAAVYWAVDLTRRAARRRRP